MKMIGLLLLLPICGIAQWFSPTELNKWKKQASQVEIIRDSFGIPHVYGKTDADAVFGLLYAQCEDDFARVEMNYLEKLGRLSEINGEKDLYEDLLIRMIIDTTEAKKDFANSPAWLTKLLNAYADGINYFLATHPSTKPRLLKKFEPWYPLLWTDGSIGAIDIADIRVNDLQQFYAPEESPITWVKQKEFDPLPGGSNGFAIAASKTKNGNSLLFINPHVTHYFRPEVSMESNEGLHAYGAVTWGQFFIYQGFNQHLGWMHTSSYSDVADTYFEKIRKGKKGYEYFYGQAWKPVLEKDITIHYVKAGKQIAKTFKTYATHHGPIMAKKDGHWISVKANNRDIKGLMQSWLRTKATNLDSYTKTMELLANTSNNTVYADANKNIAYWHGNFMPKRNKKFNWNKAVDGSNPETEWQGLHPLSEMMYLHNPSNGWIQNCNSSPFTAAGDQSPKENNFPNYMAPNGDNFRGIRAVQLLKPASELTLQKLIEIGYDPYLAAFDLLIPILEKVWKENQNEVVWKSLNEPMQSLMSWDRKSSEQSIATTLAIEWGQKLWPSILKGNGDPEETPDVVIKTRLFGMHANAENCLSPLLKTVEELKLKFGTWQIPWGQINRFQRISANLTHHFSDSLPSFPVGFAASTWGALPSFVSKSFEGTHKRYGYSGNSFVCAVEFGEKIVAKSLLAGGESGDPNSPHFFDQGLMYSKGMFKDVLFYKDEVLKQAKRKYHPGG